ncbi:hypothetical protein [Sphingopyxis sp.]|uniref:hypothetical protein n=1 Tax=Sphingopyxis sp. TaxID=1908224 RepID=UPI0025D2F71A|nr:hypothetical protein [Sphingopyxis sp.]
MPGATPAVAETAIKVKPRNWPMTVLRWIGLSLLGLILLFALFLIGLNSDAGRRFVVTQVEKYEFENGMKIGIGRLDGSLYGRMVIRNFTLSDPTGVFLESPEVRVDWRPIRYFANHVDVRSATAATMTMRKMPAFKVVPDTGEPLLPDLDIDVGALRVDRFIFEPAVAGERQEARLAGKIAIANRRAQITANAATIGANAKGDTLALLLDAVPEANRFDVTMNVTAPQGGVIAAMGGFQRAIDREAGGARRLESLEWQSQCRSRYCTARTAGSDGPERHVRRERERAGGAAVHRCDGRAARAANRGRSDGATG